HRGDLRPEPALDLLLRSRIGLGAERAGVHPVPALAQRAVEHPDGAVALGCNGATGDALPRPREGDRLTPLAAAVGPDPHLVGELGLVKVLEVVRLLLVLRLLDAAALVAERVADVGDPEGAVGAVAGGWEIILRAPHDGRRGGRNQADDRGAVPQG